MHKQLKIGFLQDLDPFTEEGGGQMNDKGMLIKGFQRNHSIDIITPNNISLKPVEKYDLLILSNVMSFPRPYLKQVTQKKPYVFFHHDYNFCNHRLFFPMQQKCIGCINREFWLDIYMNAKSHIFLSPLHHKAYLFAYPELKKFKEITIPSCMEVDNWKPDTNYERLPGTVVGVNCLEEFKGRKLIERYVAEHPELSFTFVGTSDNPLPFPNCQYIGFVINEELPKLYSQHEYFIHLPTSVEPFGRVNAEAKLCGCKIITNENNGAFSYEFMKDTNLDNTRKLLSLASLSFWEEIENVMGVFDYNKISKSILD